MVESRIGPEKEQRLVEAIRQGRQDAFSLLYDAYAPALMGMICRVVQHTEVAEEVLKETFLSIWSRIHIYDPSKSGFLSWALAMARGIALEAQKTGKYLHLTQTALQEPVSEKEGKKSPNLLEDAQTQEAFCQLEPQEKAVIDLIYLKGYSCSQAAEALGISQEQLKSHLKLAFKHLGAEKTA
ncbi:RNA polymerase sigma factor [Rufibacter aurantiacus]|uniref:RNA polymerase sigma factor n=1 Tax=Rufibacter aurantiacus TaxID=2817374 RepID=UPI001B312FE2|nr:sigma-70 family RNA polymerase sigma factor [Rufibacter aurantiacus]